jgi:putative lipoic acid-binding regulatory protein
MLSQEAKDRLRERLDQVHEWPSVYMFKFIFEPENTRLEAVLALFPKESEILRKYSTAGKYLSITVKEVMLSADEVVQRYDQASEIDGVIVL